MIPHDDLQQLLEDVSNTLGAWTYLLVGVFAFAETGAFVGLVVPGETVMLLGGAVAGQGAIDIYLLIAIAWFSAWAGDTTSFFIGRRLGREFVLRHGPALRHRPRALRAGRGLLRPPRRQDDLHRPLHQPRARLRPLHRRQLRDALPRLRPLQHPRHRALGERPHPDRLLLLAQHRHRRQVRRPRRLPARHADRRSSSAPSALARRFRVEENRRAAVRWMEDARGDALAGRPRRAASSPQLSFLWERVTPGGTFGLEFTSLMATLAVATFVLVAYTVIVSGDPGRPRATQRAIDIAESLRSGLAGRRRQGRHRARLAPRSCLPLAAIAAAALAARRRWAEVGVLVAGMAIVVVGVHELKDAVDRPRPDGGLVATSGSSFPSAHAAYSTFYVWLAVTIVMRLRPGMARGARWSSPRGSRSPRWSASRASTSASTT